MVNNNKKKTGLAKGEKLAGLAIWLEGFLAIAKAIIGLASGSLVLITDAIHSASDLLSIITSWLGLRIAQKKATKRFSYGYYKAENIGTLIISALIIYGFWEMFTQGLSSLTHPSQVSILLLAMGVSLVDALFLFFFGNYEVRVGEEIGAQSLIAMGKENRTHIFSSSAVLIGTLAAYYQIPYLEGIITMGISLLILEIGLSSGKEAVLSLMDVSPGKEVEEKIAQAIKESPGVEEFWDLKLRKSGPYVFGQVKVGVRKFIDVNRAHEIADKIEKRVKKAVSNIDSLAVHIEPFRSDFRHLVIPVKDKKDLASSLDSRFGRAEYFLFVNLKKDQVKGFYFIDNKFKDKKVRAGLASAKLIADQKSQILLANQVGEISFHILRDNLVDIYQIKKAKTAKEAINLFLKGEANQLLEPTQEKN
ncbi:MAG: cation diffusion facilitator family transporter [Candidatus Shapirobacteria bacterium]|nr:cation diffusion facilitator family transporter [Candidatus Shapirobacteria bacterium]MDD5073567.1 cation diffusion facilitator family transporter [Candidatus Shapirobacteria bacterium]MDD5482015.1 cation diffusion facilitator family transporter [Candidatus Shapirobacteria bacterium]